MPIPVPTESSCAVVTGASSGIGMAIAQELARLGHNLVLVARRAARLQRLAAQLAEQYGVRVEIAVCDLADAEDRSDLIETLIGSEVSVLINNAGVGTVGLFADADPVREAQELALNVLAVHELTLALLPPMVRRGRGAILMTGSCAGNQPCPVQATYGATKAFVNSLSESLFFELVDTGVTCTLLAPGPVRTEFAEIAEFGEVDDRLPDWAWISAEQAAREAIAGLVEGRRRVVPGGFAKAQTVAGRHMPASVSGPLIRSTFQRLAGARP